MDKMINHLKLAFQSHKSVAVICSDQAAMIDRLMKHFPLNKIELIEHGVRIYRYG